MSKDELITNTLLAEYSEMRAELRDYIKSMDTNFRTGIAMLSGVFAIGVSFKDERILFIIPTIIFISTSIHLAKFASTAIVSTYCQIIAEKIKSHLGRDNVVMDWEGGRFAKYIAQPMGIVHKGFYLFFLPFAAAFCIISYRAYLFWKPSLFIHIIEFALIVIYSVRCYRWNIPNTRGKILNEYVVDKTD